MIEIILVAFFLFLYSIPALVSVGFWAWFFMSVRKEKKDKDNEIKDDLDEL